MALGAWANFQTKETDMANKTSFDASRISAFSFDPDDLVLINDPTHPLYDARIKLPLKPEFVANIKALGVTVPVVVRKINGEPAADAAWNRRSAPPGAAPRREIEPGDPQTFDLEIALHVAAEWIDDVAHLSGTNGWPALTARLRGLAGLKSPVHPDPVHVCDQKGCTGVRTHRPSTPGATTEVAVTQEERGSCFECGNWFPLDKLRYIGGPGTFGAYVCLGCPGARLSSPGEPR